MNIRCYFFVLQDVSKCMIERQKKNKRLLYSTQGDDHQQYHDKGSEGHRDRN